MNYPNWSVRNENNYAVIRIDGKDYVEIPGTIENVQAAPDNVQNKIVDTHENGSIKVLLGATRQIVNEMGNTTRSMPAQPQYVWLSPYTSSK